MSNLAIQQTGGYGNFGSISSQQTAALFFQASTPVGSDSEISAAAKVAAVAGASGQTGVAGKAYQVEDAATSEWQDPQIRALKRSGQVACETCQSRMYQDGSNDPGVSFKAPGHIAPGSSAAVVGAHEQEHVSHEQANAKMEKRKVVAQSVQLFTDVCPECGRVYVSGGETKTTTAADNSKTGADLLGEQLDLST